MTIPGATSTDLIRCRNAACPVPGGMPLALRWPNGSVSSLGPATHDERGRLHVTCPACGERNRLYASRTRIA